MATHRVLLCDDEFHILRAAEIKLRRAGFDVVTASNGAEALELIEQHRPDILVTDYQMPRLDGIGLCERLRENPATATMPITMLTAKGYELSEAELTPTLSIAAIVPKPFSPRQLAETCTALLAGAPATTPVAAGAEARTSS